MPKGSAEASEQARLAALEARLAALRAREAPRPEGTDHIAQGQLAWRMVTELVAGIVIGVGMGLGLDALFGTRPWMLVLFTLLGLAAGVRTMMRTAAEVEAKMADGGRPPAPPQEEETRG